MIDARVAALAGEYARALRPEIETLFRQQWADPELPGMEVRAAARLANWLAGHGFAVEKGAGGLPTAFVARSGPGGGPVAALLAEYDALPGLDNEAAPVRKSLGLAAGHGCGHNHIGPANAGAAVVAALVCRELGIGGEIRVIGCPAEEILWGKIALFRAGVFAGIDAILTSHGDYQTGALSRPCQAVVSGEFVYASESGHGGQTGQRNALLVAEEAVSAAIRAIETDYPGVLLRHVLRKAGVMPSIMPSETRLWFTTRGFDYERTRGAYEAIARLASDAARHGGVSCRHQFISESRGYLPNDTLGRLLFAAMRAAGGPQWTEADLAFMRALCHACAPEEQMEIDSEIRYFDSGEDYYGQDDGEVSWRIPLGRVNWAYPKQVPIHHWAWTALSGHPAGSPGPLAAAQALAMATVTLLGAPALIVDAQLELRRRVAGIGLTQPRLGALATMTQAPESFWAASWVE
ncbi:MAG: amidohydrolase [Aestuariivirga sp.]|uniref:amidohydrolase n=1 Tax=Aestuariivirga sp. TaxID=2650926 RepID=UPI0038D09E2F